MMSGEGEPLSDEKPDAVCIVQKIGFRPGKVPGAHELVRATTGAASDVLEIGIAAPRAIFRHAGHLVSPGVEEVPPE